MQPLTSRRIKHSGANPSPRLVLLAPVMSSPSKPRKLGRSKSFTAAAELSIEEKHAAQRAYFDKGKTKPISWRKKQLRSCIKFCEEQYDNICTALTKDLGKTDFEGQMTEIEVTLLVSGWIFIVFYIAVCLAILVLCNMRHAFLAF